MQFPFAWSVQSLAKRGIRANSVAPGPIWTPLIPSTIPAEKVKKFGETVPMKRPGQPAELAPCTCCSPPRKPAISPAR
jgi:NAD(P)-dependent dehydrogenase (short-subunit alcohol dehydrogenase family)